MRIRIQPYKAASQSARALARTMNVKRINLVRTSFRPRRDDVVINWGSGICLFPDEFYINHPENAALAQNKLQTYAIFAAGEVQHPPFTVDPETARGWLVDGHSVLCRYLLRASRGDGIVLFRPEDYDDFLHARHAPLYVQYKKKRDEYRIHVMNGQVIDVQQKRKRRGYDERDNQIRNAGNGWVFCRQDITPPPACVTDAAVRAVQSLGLHFGAADVGYNAHYEEPCVYEVNTAPGLEGTTLEIYARELARLCAAR